MLKLLVSLETPAKDEVDEFPNLFDEVCLKKWLSIYYRDRQAIMATTSFSTRDDGSIEINFHDADNMPATLPDNIPLNKHPGLVGGAPCYFVYLNPGIIEFNLAIGHSDVLQFRFQIRYLTDDVDIKQQLNQVALNFSQQIIKTVKIDLSTKENDLRAAPAATIESSVSRLK